MSIEALGLLAHGLESGINAYDQERARKLKERESEVETALKKKQMKLMEAQYEHLTGRSPTEELPKGPEPVASQQQPSPTQGLLSQAQSQFVDPDEVPIMGVPKRIGDKIVKAQELNAQYYGSGKKVVIDPKTGAYKVVDAPKSRDALLKEQAQEQGLLNARLEAQQKQKALSTPTEAQANAALYGRRLENDEKIFDELQQKGYRAEGIKENLAKQASNLPLIGSIANQFVSPEGQAQEQAERDFINAILRRESGAAIAQSEFDSAAKQYFPRPGDSPQVLEQKRANRELAKQGLLSAAGSVALQNLPKQNNTKSASIKSQKIEGMVKEANAGSSDVKIINGKKYKKVKGGWETE